MDAFVRDYRTHQDSQVPQEPEDGTAAREDSRQEASEAEDAFHPLESEGQGNASHSSARGGESDVNVRKALETTATIIGGVLVWGGFLAIIGAIAWGIAALTSWWFVAGAGGVLVVVFVAWLSFVIQMGRNWG